MTIRALEKKALGFLAILWVVYCGISLASYALAHPHKTQTQVLLSVGDALLWDWDAR